MADSRRSRRPDGDGLHPVERAVASILREVVPSGGGVAVALSGGRDSIAVLDALAPLAGALRPFAFHVHHGLSAHADAWTSFCRDACAARDVAFAVRHVHDCCGVGIVQSPGTSSPAWESLDPEDGPPLVVAGSWGADYYAPIGPADGELEIVKHRHSGFVATRLDLALRSMGIKTVVFGGVASNVCVEATARDAADYDYYVVVLGDASGAVRDELHQASLYTIRTYIGRVAESADVARLWAERRLA